MEVYEYEAYFDGIELVGIGTVEANNVDDAIKMVSGMFGLWYTKDGEEFRAGIPSTVIVQEGLN